MSELAVIAHGRHYGQHEEHRAVGVFVFRADAQAIEQLVLVRRGIAHRQVEAVLRASA